MSVCESAATACPMNPTTRRNATAQRGPYARERERASKGMPAAPTLRCCCCCCCRRRCQRECVKRQSFTVHFHRVRCRAFSLTAFFLRSNTVTVAARCCCEQRYSLSVSLSCARSLSLSLCICASYTNTVTPKVLLEAQRDRCTVCTAEAHAERETVQAKNIENPTIVHAAHGYCVG